MGKLLTKIDKYLSIKEKNDVISLSLNKKSNINDIIEIVRSSKDKDKTISMFNEKIRHELYKLKEGGIL